MTVVVGDTPWGLAERHLGNGIRWRELWDLNRGMPQPDGRAWVTEDLILVGWHLRLPAGAIGIASPPAPARAPTPDGHSSAPEPDGTAAAPLPNQPAEEGSAGEAGPASEAEGETGSGPGADSSTGPGSGDSTGPGRNHGAPANGQGSCTNGQHSAGTGEQDRERATTTVPATDEFGADPNGPPSGNGGEGRSARPPGRDADGPGAGEGEDGGNPERSEGSEQQEAERPEEPPEERPGETGDGDGGGNADSRNATGDRESDESEPGAREADQGDQGDQGDQPAGSAPTAPTTRRTDRTERTATTGDGAADDATHSEEPTAAHSPDDGSSGWPVLAGVTGATVLATGLAFEVRRRRHRRMVATAHARWEPDDPDDAHTEQAIAAASDLPLTRWAGHHLAELVANHPPGHLDGTPVALEPSHEAGIELLWSAPNPQAPKPWSAGDGGWTWRLPYDPDEPTPDNDRPAGIPGLVTLGVRNGRHLLVDLEALGALSIEGDDKRAAELARSIALELATSEELAGARVCVTASVSHLLPAASADDNDGVPDRLVRSTGEQALHEVTSTVTCLGDTLERSFSDSTFDYRLGSQAWVGVLAVVVSANDPHATDLVKAGAPHRGVATIVVGAAPDAPAHITVEPDGSARIAPLGVPFQAAGLTAESAERAVHLLSSLDQPAGADDTRSDDGDPGTAGRGTGDPDAPEFPVVTTHFGEDDEFPDVGWAGGIPDPGTGDVPPRDQGGHEARRRQGAGRDGDGHDNDSVDGGAEDSVAEVEGPEPPDLLVKVLGRPYVPARPGLKKRELGLVVFLASRGQPTVASTVQHAVWNGNAVQTKTLWNVATDTRAALGRLDDGSPAMPASRRAHNTLELAPGVRTDLQLLHDIHDHAQDMPSSRAVDLLARGLDLIEGQPFDGPDYEWAHHTELLVADATKLVESVTNQLVDLASVAGRFDLARHGIRQGLRALPGNEVLYRLRMQVEHDAGNLAGVRAAYNELASYLADIEADPSPATVDLYHRLLSKPRRTP